MFSRPPWVSVALTGLAGAVLVGCSGSPEPPLAPVARAGAFVHSRNAVRSEAPGDAANLFFPLELGNQWDYAGSFRVQTVPVEGAPGDPVEIRSTQHVELTCIEPLASGDYVVEQTHAVEESPLGQEAFDTWVRFRQDRSGLYEADVAGNEPPACAGAVSAASIRASRRPGASTRALDRALAREGGRAAAFERAAAVVRLKLAALDGLFRPQDFEAGGAEPRLGEITRLAYPLHTGASWVIRGGDPSFVATVEGTDVVSLPAGRFTARRVRIEIGDLLGPEDRIVFWYSSEGLLQMTARLTGEATDDQGNLIGMMVSEQRLELTGLDLSRPGLR